MSSSWTNWNGGEVPSIDRITGACSIRDHVLSTWGPKTIAGRKRTNATSGDSSRNSRTTYSTSSLWAGYEKSRLARSADPSVSGTSLSGCAPYTTADDV